MYEDNKLVVIHSGSNSVCAFYEIINLHLKNENIETFFKKSETSATTATDGLAFVSKPLDHYFVGNC